ncbi:MBL fold metallo-hydrolase [Chloroflexota bacterium]
MEIIPGIYRFKIPIPESTLRYVNVYLIKGDSGYLLVDTGWDNNTAFAALNRQLGEIGADISEIARVMVTHVHPDHYGLVGRIKEVSGSEFALHPKEEALIDSRYIHMDDLLEKTAEWLRINGVPPRELPSLQRASLPVAKYVAPTYPDVRLKNEETFSFGDFTFQTLWTPGHSPGHVCLYEPQRRILLAGDHILPNITPNIGLHTQSGANPLGDFINSLNKIRELDVTMVLPGHEEPFHGLPSRINKILGHHHQRNEEILTTLGRKISSAYRIAQGITWLADIGGVGWKNLDPRDKRLAILETLSHLELMRHEGKVAKFSRDGMVYYQRAQ